MAGPGLGLPGRGGRQDLGEEGHAVHGAHGDVERPGDVHGHGVGQAHGGGDVDRGDVHRPGDGDRVLQAHGVGADVHLRRDGDRVAWDQVAAVHRRGDGHGGGDRGSGGRIAHVVRVWVEERERERDVILLICQLFEFQLLIFPLQDIPVISCFVPWQYRPVLQPRGLMSHS